MSNYLQCHCRRYSRTCLRCTMKVSTPSCLSCSQYSVKCLFWKKGKKKLEAEAFSRFKIYMYWVSSFSRSSLPCPTILPFWRRHRHCPPLPFSSVLLILFSFVHLSLLSSLTSSSYPFIVSSITYLLVLHARYTKKSKTFQFKIIKRSISKIMK